MLADDSVLLREGVASLLEGKGFEIVGQSGTADDLLLKVRSYNPDIAIGRRVTLDWIERSGVPVPAFRLAEASA